MDAASGAEGQWIADALERYIGKKDYFGAVAAIIPDQFESYARIFHPLGGYGEPELRCADLARAKNTEFHPEAQFHRLARTELYRCAEINGHDVGRPESGELNQVQLVLPAELFAAHTPAPRDIFQAVWVGWGGFEPGHFEPGGFEPGRGSIPAGADPHSRLPRALASIGCFAAVWRNLFARHTLTRKWGGVRKLQICSGPRIAVGAWLPKLTLTPPPWAELRN